MQHETITSGDGAKGTAKTFAPGRFTRLLLRNTSGVTVTVFLNGSATGFPLKTAEDLTLDGKTVRFLTSVATSSSGGSHVIEAWAS